jgi:hypothetical protein
LDIEKLTPPPVRFRNHLLERPLMLRRLFVAVLLFAATSAHALDTYRFGSRLVEVGDTVGKLISVAGDPVYKEAIETPQGGREGERWQYNADGKSITFVIKDSKIASIEQIRN